MTARFGTPRQRIIVPSETDTGNAQRLIKKYGNTILYNNDPSKTWFIWNGKRWQQDDINLIYKFAHQSLEEIDDNAWAKTSQSAASKKNMISLASTFQQIAVRVNQLDTNPWLLNCENCTLDLESGIVNPVNHNKKHLITKIVPVEYNPEALCPGWLDFVEYIFEGDKDLINYIQQLVGYSLTGDVSEEMLLFAYGTGKNGKSRFFDALELLLGEYFYKASKHLIINCRSSSVPHDTINLQGKRIVVCSEMDEADNFSESMIKDLTGGDTINARGLYRNPVNFQPTHTLWIYGNHKPIIQGTDYGVWRRIKLIPFQ